MNDKLKAERANPYDLPAVRRDFMALAPKPPAPPRQPYTLSSSQRLTKSAVVLRAKRIE
jgi:hypothetical protein